MEDLVSVTAIAKSLGMTKSSVYTFINRGVFPAFKIGKALRLSPEEIRTALQKMKKKARGEAVAV